MEILKDSSVSSRDNKTSVCHCFLMVTLCKHIIMHNIPSEIFHYMLIEHVMVVRRKYENADNTLMFYGIVEYNCTINWNTKFTRYELMMGHPETCDSMDLIRLAQNTWVWLYEMGLTRSVTCGIENWAKACSEYWITVVKKGKKTTMSLNNFLNITWELQTLWVLRI